MGGGSQTTRAHTGEIKEFILTKAVVRHRLQVGGKFINSKSSQEML